MNFPTKEQVERATEMLDARDPELARAILMIVMNWTYIETGATIPTAPDMPGINDDPMAAERFIKQHEGGE
jgi:hypothetical protein